MALENRLDNHMRSFVKLIGLMSVFALTACSTIASLNPFATVDEKNGPAALQPFASSMAVKQAWAFKVGSAGNYVFSPSQVDAVVYAAGKNGTIVKLEAKTGRPIWRINAKKPLAAGVGADSTTIAVVAEKGELMAFDPSGKLRWVAQASSEVLMAPAVANGLVIVRSIDNRIAAYDSLTGARKWAVDRPLPPLTLRLASGIALSDQLLVAALPAGKLIALSPSNGVLRWEVAAAEPKGATELERIVDIPGTPIISGQIVCTAAYQGRISCFDLASGALRWTKNLSSEVGVGLDERFVFAVDNAGAISAYARDMGASVWKNDKLVNRHLSTPVSFGRAVAVADAFGYVHFLSREDGSFIGRVSTDGSQIKAAPLVAGSNLIVQTKSGTVVALATE